MPSIPVTPTEKHLAPDSGPNPVGEAALLVESIFRKPGRLWDVLARSLAEPGPPPSALHSTDPAVRVRAIRALPPLVSKADASTPGTAILAACLLDEDKTIRVEAARVWAAVTHNDGSIDTDPNLLVRALQWILDLGREVACHYAVLPLVVECLLDASAEARAAASRIRDRWFSERNRVHRWMYEPGQLRRLLGIARWKAGPGQEWDAWQEFAYRTRQDEKGPRLYFYSLPNVIASYDPLASGGAAFPGYLYSCFARYCAREFHPAPPPALATDLMSSVIFDDAIGAANDVEALFQLARLEDREAKVLLDSYVEELDDSEIALSFGVEGTGIIRVWRHRALNKLKRARRFAERLDRLPAECRPLAWARYRGPIPAPTSALSATDRALLVRAQEALLEAATEKIAVAIADLDDAERDAWVLTRAAECTPGEIADRLAIPLTKVKAVLKSGARTLGGG